VWDKAQIEVEPAAGNLKLQSIYFFVMWCAVLPCSSEDPRHVFGNYLMPVENGELNAWRLVVALLREANQALIRRISNTLQRNRRICKESGGLKIDQDKKGKKNWKLKTWVASRVKEDRDVGLHAEENEG